MSDRKLRILGVAVHTVEGEWAAVPSWRYSMSLLYLKSYLSKFDLYPDVDFQLRNFHVATPVDDMLADLKAISPQLVLFSVYVWNFKIYRRLAAEIKKLDPSITIVLGGPEVNEDTYSILSACPHFDIIVRGEGEHAFYEIVQRRLDESALTDVLGITYRCPDRIVRNADQPPDRLTPLDVIPSIYSPDIYDWSVVAGSYAALETQRGCNFSCGFCRYRKIGQGARFFTLERVFRELQFLKQVGIKHLYLMDPTFNNNIQRAKSILRHIVDLDMRITLNAEMIPEFLDAETLELALAAGMHNLEVGIQSINKGALRTMQRPRNAASLDSRIAMASAVRANGKRLNVVPQIIFGLPGESFEDFCRTFDYTYSLPVDEMQIFHLLVLRDTQFYRDRAKYDFVYEAEPPHRLMESASFSRSDMIVAGKLGCVAMSTQHKLRPLILRYCEKHSLTPSQFFLERVRLQDFRDSLAYSFPIHFVEQAQDLIEASERIGRVMQEDGDPAAEPAVSWTTKLLMVRAKMVAPPSDDTDRYYNPHIGETVAS